MIEAKIERSGFARLDEHRRAWIKKEIGHVLNKLVLVQRRAALGVVIIDIVGIDLARRLAGVKPGGIDIIAGHHHLDAKQIAAGHHLSQNLGLRAGQRLVGHEF